MMPALSPLVSTDHLVAPPPSITGAEKLDTQLQTTTIIEELGRDDSGDQGSVW